MKQQNKNFVLNVGYQLLMYLFPLVSAAYVSRVLGAESIGIYSYVNSIATICGMFGILGIANYGNREVAKVRDDPKRLSETFSSIYCLQLLLSAAVLVLYITAITAIPTEHKSLFYIHALNIIAVGCDITWLFFGLERFKLVLFRNFLVKLASMLLILLLVHSSADLWKYTIIMSASTLLSQAVLLAMSAKVTAFRISALKAVFAHFKSCAVLFIPVIAFSIYRIMDKTMLGAICEKSQLGFYENAERVINIPIMVISALGTVMLPHMAYSIENKKAEYRKTIAASMRLALSIACFSTVGLITIGKDLCVALFGSDYSYSGYIVMLLAFTVVASAWANVIRTQYLIPKSLDKIYVTSTLLGAVINLIFNFIFIKPLGAAGACVGTLLAEFSIAVYQTVRVYRQLDFKLYFKELFLSLLKAALTCTVIYFIGSLINQLYLRLAVQLLIAIALFVVLNYKFVFYEFLGIKSTKSEG